MSCKLQTIVNRTQRKRQKTRLCNIFFFYFFSHWLPLPFRLRESGPASVAFSKKEIYKIRWQSKQFVVINVQRTLLLLLFHSHSHSYSHSSKGITTRFPLRACIYIFRCYCFDIGRWLPKSTRKKCHTRFYDMHSPCVY